MGTPCIACHVSGPRADGDRAALGTRPGAFAIARARLTQYFTGEPIAFDIELVMEGTPFQLRVWRALQAIPYGETISYGELAWRIGRPSAPRAVGVANGRNPIAVTVPCHRVIGSNGTLTGYGGGTERKRLLPRPRSPRGRPAPARSAGGAC